MSDIIVVGSVNADLVVQVARAPEAGETVIGEGFSVYNGGKGANQAYAAARLGGAVSMLARVGADAYGRDQLANLRSVGVSVERIRELADSVTGTALITVERSGENRIVVVPGANGAFGRAELEKDLRAFAGARFALFQLETPLETVARGLEEARRQGVVTLLDPAPAQPLSDALLQNVDYLTPNLSELRSLTRQALPRAEDEEAIVAAARLLIGRGVGKVMAKLGELGALLVDGESVLRFPAFPVAAIDTTAAGDCFNAAFAVALARGDAEHEAGRFACAAAACSVAKRGAQAGMPSLEEVLDFIGSRDPSAG